MKMASVEQMRQCDAYTIENCISGMELIYRAAYSVFREVHWRGTIGIVAGSGNNGADGFALACILKEHNMDCTVFTVSSRLHKECASWEKQAILAGVRILPFEKGCLREFDVLVDCMLGTGFSGGLKETYREAILEINGADAYVISVDINSGMNGDSGAGEIVVLSDLTVAVEFVKKGQVTPEAGSCIKRLTCVQIGIEDIFGLECITDYECVPWIDPNIKQYV